MLSLQQAYEIRESIIAYLNATFTFQDKKVHKAFYDFLTDNNNGIFKGPFVSIKLPFVKAKEEDIATIPLEIKPSWPPYDHQVKSWHRLSTANGQNPEPAIVTTGTGSGKTEAFLYPLLDYCYQNRHRTGIKVIILYPMNALATDQAKRLAEAIYEDDRLRGVITAGLFIGEGKDAKKYPKTMGADNIIENRDSIVDAAPDILLTNFKMLDYGLMQSKYHSLWSANLKDTELLKFLVLDELHTYDGAQGTDVANLIRRLKLKLNIPKGQICPVGTSATIGSGEEAPQMLADYAARVFGEEFNSTAIITENRISIDEFYGNRDKSELDDNWPGINSLRKSQLLVDDSYEDYLKRQLKLWNLSEETNSLELGDYLKNKLIVYDLLKVCESGVKTVEEIIRALSDINLDFKGLPQLDPVGAFNPKETVLQSLLALITEAKSGNSKKKFPFLFVNTQLWVRELSGVLRSFTKEPVFTWKDDVTPNGIQALPPWFCRECGASGWLGEKHDNKNRLEQDIQDVYSKFFSNHRHIYLINTPEHEPIDGYEPTDIFRKQVNNSNFEFYDSEAEDRVKVVAVKKINDRGFNDHVCPECTSRNSLSIIGTRVATLSSIAVGQVLATDLDAQPEQKRKVLAFTNSVQDAAHQAGFIEARNYNFTFRASLQKVLNQQDKPISLTDLSEKFISYWKEKADETGHSVLDAFYYRFFPSDYIGKATPADYYEKGHYSTAFQREFDERVKWQIFSEFGYNALIGRTLEKTTSSAVAFDEPSLEKLWQLMEPWMDHNNLGMVSRDEFLRFITLLLYRTRTRGAINHPYFSKFRNGDLRLWDLNWMRDERHFLNNRFGPRVRIPRILTAERDNRGVLDSTYTRNTNWFHAYFRKCFLMAPNTPDLVNEFYAELLAKLVEAEIFDVAHANNISNYAINPDKVFALNQAYTLECSGCGHKVYTSGNQRFIDRASCINYQCNGHYIQSESTAKPNYYQLVYNRTRSPRIYAADHTGLLERKERELKENDFKNRSRFNSLNALVATSTLEMGIDIGTLNTAINNAVPPLPSNYLQRIGRAGRSSGSAFILNFAQSKAHDLYYFAEPKDIMEGEVATPGCYLEAKEILKRHFFAFCIDTWTSFSPTANEIPSKVRFLRISTSDLHAPEFFMNRILSFIKSKEQVLFERFKEEYKNEVEEEVFSELLLSLKSDAFYQFYKSIFKKLQDEYLSIAKKRKEIDLHIKKQNLGVEDPDRIEQEREKKNLWGILKSLEKRSVLEHLTNIGALPNYAFPETGVVLNAKVLGNKAIGSTKPPINKDFEIVRSSSVALKEFAPDNHFYSQGFKFKVTGVNTFDWSDQSVYHDNRFCSNCDHLEDAVTAQKGPCPKCGHESWGAASNVHKFAKLTTVKSFNSQSDATLTDNKDERDSLQFNLSTHFNFKEDSSQGAWAMKRIPFGIEFVKQVTITNTNLGRTDVVNARKLVVNEKEVPAHGFITCRHCGKSSSHYNQPEYKAHYAFCIHKEKEYEGKPDEVFQEIFFFRSISTEALKILLPVQELDSEEEILQFMAGIELGLKKYYKGNPQHISISKYKEYNNKTLKFDRYLVLYDTVPGGTGYLEKLFDRTEFSKLLKNAYEAIKDCACQHNGKDGCYRCIYSYGNQFYRNDLSRARAEKRFKRILEQNEGWEKMQYGLGSVTSAGQIEESELEERFIRSLRKRADKLGWQFEDIKENGVINYTLTIKSKGLDVSYHIRPQVDLGPSDGVAFLTRTDFIFQCTSFVRGGKTVEGEDLLGIPKFAIYLDGYQYHASRENNRFSTDVQKRKAIVDNPEYKTWTLTWYDLEQFDEDKDDSLAELLSSNPFAKTRKDLNKIVKGSSVPFISAKNSLERFLVVLENPVINPSFKKLLALYLSFYHENLYQPSFDFADLKKVLNFSQPFIGNNVFIKDAATLKDGLLTFQGVKNSPLFESRTFVSFVKGEVISRFKLQPLLHIDKEDWKWFWHYFNLMQFGDFDSADIVEVTNDDVLVEGHINIDESDEGDPLEILLEQFGEEYYAVIRYYFNQCVDEFINLDLETINSLTNDKGKVVAEAELVIGSKKIVFDPFSDEDIKVFEKAGFKVYHIKNFDLDIIENEATHLR
ncbi:DEAD/DEAH box helicase [Pontibacter oryzae]|uniref:DUF1998 domain-containing protein n=1 Tax=Pontibacter oryzae TaxID=2304593 RepID=A0A399SI29_9BACT|nr:DEAD/DEAH box helicase [Pontibacter oryzae]RIJ42671.1 DUF1998 domain-containing protein [Pontibacter oryzae]